MAFKPYTWVSWCEARRRMPEIWSGWQWDRDHADKAMVSCLKRDNVPYRGEARVAEADLLAMRSVPLKDVVAGLLKLTFDLAEYERTEATPIFRRMPFEMPPRPVKKTAQLLVSELAWEPFRDDLIHFELPAGAVPTPTQKRKPSIPKSTKLKAVSDFLDEKYPEGIPAGLSDKEIARLIEDKIKLTISPRTIRRARSG